MEIEQQPSIMHQASAGGVAIAQDHVPAGVLGRVGPDQGEQMLPLGVVAVVVVHDLHLPEVDGFKAEVNVRGRLVIKPKLRFEPARIGHLGVPHSPTLSHGINDVGVNEVPLLHRLAEGGEHPVRHSNPLHARIHGLKDAGFEDQLRIGGDGLGNLLPGTLEIGQETVLRPPQAQAPSGILDADAFEHANIVIEVAPPVEHSLDRDRP